MPRLHCRQLRQSVSGTYVLYRCARYRFDALALVMEKTLWSQKFRLVCTKKYQTTFLQNISTVPIFSHRIRPLFDSMSRTAMFKPAVVEYQDSVLVASLYEGMAAQGLQMVKASNLVNLSSQRSKTDSAAQPYTNINMILKSRLRLAISPLSFPAVLIVQ